MFPSRISKWPLLFVLISFFITVGSTQTRTTARGAGNTGGNLGSAPGRNVGTLPTTPRTMPNTSTSLPLFLTGKVVLDPGGEVPQPVAIERVCNGHAHREGYTDSHGNFSIRWGDNSFLQDASEGEGARPTEQQTVTETQLWNCELQGALPGYTSSVIPLAGRDVHDITEVGTIVLRKIGGVEGNSISAVSMRAPDNALGELEKGMKELKQRKYADAEKHLAKATKIYPKYATAWELLGEVQQAQQQYDQAVQSFQSSIQSDPKFVPPYIHMAHLEGLQQKWQDVIEWTNKAIALDPVNYPIAYYLNSVANFNLRHIPEAERSASKTIEVDKRHGLPAAELLLGRILAIKGDTTGATQHLRAYLMLEPNSPDAERVKTALARMDQAGGSLPK